MVSKPKPSQSLSLGTMNARSESPTEDVSDNREKDLERRLALLGDVPIVEEDEEDEDEEETQPNLETQPTLLSAPAVMNPVIMNPRPIMLNTNEAQVETAPVPIVDAPAPIVEEVVEAPPVVVEPEPSAEVVSVVKAPVMNPRPIMLNTNEPQAAAPKAAAAPVSAMGNKNALLARIMAVQEKAKQAQLKKAAAMTDVSSPPSSVTSYKEQMMEALNKDTVTTPKEQQAPTLPTTQTLPTPPPQFPRTMMKPTTPAPTVADYRDKMMEALNETPISTKPQFVPPPPPPPPPSFDILEQKPPPPQQQQIKAPAAPPSFDTLSYAPMEDSVLPSAPPVEQTAPPLDLLSSDHLSTITSIVPPPPPAFDTLPPPTTTQTNTADEDEVVYDFDLEGNPLSPDQKRIMMEEQRAILAQIQKSTTQDSASQAAARAVAFDQRSNTAAAAALSDTANPISLSSRAASRGDGPIVVEVASSTDGVEHKVSQRSVDIGGGQKVALHGQEKTRTAIKEGTAVLVKCLNCDSWMQVTQTATLMFCPICSVVSPVVQQDAVPDVEEVRQMDEDRRLAERLQKEENEREMGGGTAAARSHSGYPASRRSQGAAAAEDSGSWLGGLLPANMWSTAEEPSSAEITVTRPPGSSRQRGGLIDANIGTRAGEGEENDLQLEQESLIGSGSQSGARPPGRVAESKPMFSCVADSIYSTGNAMVDAMSSIATREEEEVHGVDSSSFLSVTNAGREGDGAGSYRSVPDT